MLQTSYGRMAGSIGLGISIHTRIFEIRHKINQLTLWLFRKSKIWKILRHLIHNELEQHMKRFYWAEIPSDAMHGTFVINHIQLLRTFSVCSVDSMTFTEFQAQWQCIHYWVLKNPRFFNNVQHKIRFPIEVWWANYNNKQISQVICDVTLMGEGYLQLSQNITLNFVNKVPLFNTLNPWIQHNGISPHKILSLKQFIINKLRNQIIRNCGYKYAQVHINTVYVRLIWIPKIAFAASKNCST